MPKFRTKPVVKEAFRFLKDPQPDWFRDKVSDNTVVTRETFCTIQTLEGQMIAVEGDWIIQGLRGELYPCKPDIFEKTYEPI
jgi:hypothetical protein